VNEFLVVPLVDEVIGQISGLAAKDREDVFPLVERITDGLLNNKNAAKWALAEAAYEEILEWLRMKSRLKDAAVGGGSINIEAQLVGASLFTMMIFAGRDALRYGLTSVIKNVIDHPGLHLALRNSDVMKSFVKEVLRVDPPIQYTWRRALADVDLQGNKIKRGDFIAVILGSANRDEAVFQKADSVVLGRCGETPLTFGAGIHYCIGASIVTEVAGCVLKCLLDNDVLSNAVILEEEVHARPPFKGISKLSISLTNP
jgi:cytochrome P450